MYFICDGIRLLIWTGGRESNLFCFMSQMGAPERIWKIYFQIMPDEILVKLTQTEHMVHFQKNVYPEEDFKSVPAFPILNSRRSILIFHVLNKERVSWFSEISSIFSLFDL